MKKQRIIVEAIYNNAEPTRVEHPNVHPVISAVLINRASTALEMRPDIERIHITVRDEE